MLTARSPTRVLRCECRGWRLLGQSSPRGGTSLWSIDVLIGAVEVAGGTAGGSETLRHGGRGDGEGPRCGLAPGAGSARRGAELPADLKAAAAQATPKPAVWRSWRPVALVLSIVLVLGALGAYSAWRSGPVKNEVRSDPAISSPSSTAIDAAGARTCRQRVSIPARAPPLQTPRGTIHRRTQVGVRVAVPGGPVSNRAWHLPGRPGCHAEEGRRSRAHRL